MPQAQAGVGDPESFHMLVQRIAPPPDAPGVQGRTLADRLISERKTSIVSRGGEQRETRDHGATRVIPCLVGCPGTARSARSVGITARQHVGDVNPSRVSKPLISHGPQGGDDDCAAARDSTTHVDDVGNASPNNQVQYGVLRSRQWHHEGRAVHSRALRLHLRRWQCAPVLAGADFMGGCKSVRSS